MGIFEPELNKRLSMMETDDSYAARVRSALMELLPGGECSIEDVAKKLGYSKRSLQRKLQEENTSFQKQLNHTRELLAKYYVGSTDMRAEDIAYLLGYQPVRSCGRFRCGPAGLWVNIGEETADMILPPRQITLHRKQARFVRPVHLRRPQ